MRFCIVAAVFLSCLGIKHSLAQAVDKTEEVIIVQLDPSLKLSPKNCLNEVYDNSVQKLKLSNEDTLLNLHRFVDKESAVIETKCFYPDLKIIFRDYSYVLSTYCGTIYKYKNIEPYKPSTKQLANDFIFTKSLVNYFEQLKAKYFWEKYEVFYNELALTTPSALVIYKKEQGSKSYQTTVNKHTEKLEKREESPLIKTNTVSTTTIVTPGTSEPKPIVVETPKPETKPVVVETPKPETKPVVVETPKPETKPIVVEKPKTETKPVVVEKPKTETKPVVVEKPKEEPKPVVVEKKRPIFDPGRPDPSKANKGAPAIKPRPIPKPVKPKVQPKPVDPAVATGGAAENKPLNEKEASAKAPIKKNVGSAIPLGDAKVVTLPTVNTKPINNQQDADLQKDIDDDLDNDINDEKEETTTQDHHDNTPSHDEKDIDLDDDILDDLGDDLGNLDDDDDDGDDLDLDDDDDLNRK